MYVKETIDAQVICMNKGEMARLDSARKVAQDMVDAGVAEAGAVCKAIKGLQALGGTIILRETMPIDPKPH